MSTNIGQGYEEVRRRLALQRAVGKELDGVVRKASETIKLLAPGKQSDMRESQIRNVLSVAVETPSVEVIKNFIRYQMGRSSAGKTWLYNSFGQQVVADIEGPVSDAAVRAAKAVGGPDEQALRREAYLRLTRLYLGYLNRCFYYGYNTGGWEDLYREVR
jgi:hypothetical protein